ncbi:hypothetical protein ABFX02_06G026500 [Erythranthe guttata]
MEKSKENQVILPSLIKAITAHKVATDFDSVQTHRDFTTSILGIEAETVEYEKPMHSVSISMPPSPVEAHVLNNTNRCFFKDDEKKFGNHINNIPPIINSAASHQTTKQTKFHSQPMPKGSALTSNILPLKNPRIHELQDKRFDSFKTWSGKLERQISNIRGNYNKHRESEQEEYSHHAEIENLPGVHRYFDALEGPELDTLRDSEEIILPKDKQWPFLLRFPVSSFGICLGVSSQAIMWKTLTASASTNYLNVSPYINLVLWYTSLALFITVSAIYALKIIFYFEAVRREYYHPIRVNFFFAPWIALLFLAMGVPNSVSQTLHESLWYILMAPICCLEIKIYGQWMSGGQRRLSKVANPSNHLAVVGNFVGALLGASMGLKEGPIFFFAVGLAHYTVLFVTLYQRLPTNKTLPKELHPVFFLFVAAPSVASMAWARIQGSFDYGSRIAYFIALFLYFSLAVRVNFFRGFRFSLAWWAYTFPMTGAAIATIRYSDVVTSLVTKTLTVVLCTLATFTVAALLVTSIIHAFVIRDLFPNDIAIAISERRSKITTRKWYHMRSVSSDSTNIEQYLKYSDSDSKSDVEPSSFSDKDFSASVAK